MLTCLGAALAACVSLLAQPATTVLKPADQSMIRRLGYPEGSKLLIVHGDDFGEWHGVNTATIEALQQGALTSASMMVPCPWFPEAAAFARIHPGADLGLHLTLTSERTAYRWGPVAIGYTPRTLLDKEGYFHAAPSRFPADLNAREVETEIRAQIERARRLGVKPTHLDSHQGALYSSRALFERFLKVGGEYGIPIMVSRTNGHGAEWIGDETTLPPHAVVVNRISIPSNTPAASWNAFYTDAIKAMKPGLTLLVVHLAHANDETIAGTAERATWGAAWRQRDFNYVTSAAFKSLVAEQSIHLVTWRQVGRAVGLPRATSEGR